MATRARARHLKALEQLYRRVLSKRAKLQDACTDRQRSEAEDAVRRKWVAELKSFFVESNTPAEYGLHLRQHHRLTHR